MKNSRDLILGEVANISIVYGIPDSWLYLLNVYDFNFDHMTGENRELTGKEVKMCLFTLTYRKFKHCAITSN